MRVVLLSQRRTAQSALGNVISVGPASGYLAKLLCQRLAAYGGQRVGYLVSAELLSPRCAILSALDSSAGAGLRSQRRASVGLFYRR